MITNTELEYKGNQFPNNIVSYKKDLDTFVFNTENGVALQITIVRDSVIRFRYATNSIFENDFSYAITKYASRGYNHLEITETEIFNNKICLFYICNFLHLHYFYRAFAFLYYFKCFKI